MLKGNNIQLKLIEEEDLPLLVKWRNETYGEFYEYPISNSKQKIWFEKYLDSGDILFIIYMNNDRIGTIGLSKIDYRNRNAEFGRFVIDSSFRGKGFGKESLNIILKYAFEHLNLHRIYLNTFEYNLKAIDLYKKSGFKQEGIKRDHIYINGRYNSLICMGILKDEFKIKIQIISPATPDKFHCGDFWVQKDLESEFIKRGYEIVTENADIDLYLFGNILFDNYLSAPRRFCWIYSHPSFIETNSKEWKSFSNQFEHIFVLSNKFLPKIDGSSLLLGASSKNFIPRIGNPKYDIIFVGNSAKPKRVEIMKYLIKLGKYKICLAGGGWKSKLGKLIKKVDYKGDFINNNKLGEFFNQGSLSFYSAHEDMKIEGFVAVRILDIFRSSECVCISDNNPGLGEISENIPKFTDEKNLSEKIDWFLQHPEELKEVALKCRKDLEKYTFIKTVDEIEKWIKK